MTEVAEGYRAPAPPPPRKDEPAEPMPKRKPLWRGTRIALGLVVVIAGLIVGLPMSATIALPGLRDYVMRNRVGEAATFLGEIRLREEAYRAEFYEYLALDWSDVTVPAHGDVGPFGGGPAWDRLNAHPDGPVRFRYRVLVGTPGHPPVDGIPGMDGTDFAFVMQAEADLDGDGETMAIEGYSESEQLYLSRGVGGPPLTEGWE